MTPQCRMFGPWTTSLDNGSRLELSAFWSLRMNALAGLAAAPPATRWGVVLPGVVAAALAATPMLEFYPKESLAQETSPAEETPLADLSTRAAPPTNAERDEMNAKRMRAHELQQELANTHGYRLAPGELVKFIPAEQGGDARRELVALEFGENQVMLAFRERDGELAWSSAHMDERDLADVLDIVLGVRLHRVVCDQAILDVTLDGDFVFSSKYDASDPPPTEKFHIDEELAASLENTLNDALERPVKFTVRAVERPVLVARGDYHFTAIADAAGKVDEITGPVAVNADGMYQFPARRNRITGSVGSFEKFLECIGELLLMPIVDEIETRPTKRSYFWGFPNDPFVEDQTPLDAAMSDAVIAALAKQTGLTLTKESRPVQILVIEPGDAQADNTAK